MPVRCCLNHNKKKYPMFLIMRALCLPRVRERIYAFRVSYIQINIRQVTGKVLIQIPICMSD